MSALNNKIDQLIEDYKRRLITVNSERIKNIDPVFSLPIDVEKNKRLEIKAGCYRTFISELENL